MYILWMFYVSRKRRDKISERNIVKPIYVEIIFLVINYLWPVNIYEHNDYQANWPRALFE